jgi:hypothetical protein
MQCATNPLPNQQVNKSHSPSSQPTCPVCQGLLVDLRGSFRCVRCQFTICEGCEGGPAGPWLSLAD